MGGLVTRRSTASSSSSTNGEAALAVRLGARVYYAVQSQGGGYPLAQGPGLLLEGVGARARSELGGWVSGQYRWPVRYAGTSAGVEVETVAARAGLGFALPVGALHLGARLGVGVDATHLSPRPGTIDSTATLTANRWTTSFVVTASIGLWRRLGSHLWGGVELLADALPQPVHYDQQVSGVTTEVAAPAWIRPGLLVSLGI